MNEKPAWSRRARALLLSTSLLLPLGAAAAYEAPDNPFARAVARATGSYSVEGTVEERLPAGPYVYLRVRSGDAQHWLVALKASAPERRQVRATVLGSATHFHSARLDRDFDELLFAAVRGAR